MTAQINRYIEIDKPQDEVRIDVTLFDDGSVHIEMEHYAAWKDSAGVTVTREDIVKILALFDQSPAPGWRPIL